MSRRWSKGLQEPHRSLQEVARPFENRAVAKLFYHVAYRRFGHSGEFGFICQGPLPQLWSFAFTDLN